MSQRRSHRNPFFRTRFGSQPRVRLSGSNYNKSRTLFLFSKIDLLQEAPVTGNFASARLIESGRLVTAPQTWDADLALSRIRELQNLPGALLPILHALQEEFGYVDQAAVPVIADALNISHAEVH